MATISVERIERAILFVRGEKVILDADLAALYPVETKALNRAVKRNLKRFPADFVFQLTEKETAALRYQSGTFKLEVANCNFIARRPTLSAVRFHRTWRNHGRECPE